MQRNDRSADAFEEYEEYDEFEEYDEYDDEYDDDEEYVDGPQDKTAETKAIAKAEPSARNVAQDAGQSIVGGFDAMRKVRHASKMRADAEADVREIERGLEEDRDELAHREDIERNYDAIVAAQNNAIRDEKAAIAKATEGIAQQQGEIKRLNGELRAMRERHEQELRPYRNLMDSSRSRSDDAAKALANVRRSVRNAERALNEATKNRDARISAAHRAVDNAQERVGAVETELDALRFSQNGEATDTAALAKMERELSSNRDSLEAARRDVVQVTQEAQDSVDQAQRRLLSLQRDQAAAEKVAETNKAEATARKDEYDGLYRAAQAEERAHEDLIKTCETRIRDLKETREDANDRLEEARDILEEANEIHAHPETTEGLRERIADEEADLEDAQAELEELSATEQELRRSTRGARLIVLAVVIAVVAIIALVVWLVLSSS